MAELNIGGEAFYVVMEGDEDAPVVMLSNAVGVDHHMWDLIVPELLKHYRVIRYDGRGHGQSVVSEGPYSIAELGQDALGILDSLGLEKVDFIGLSLGGAVGQWLLSHAPRRIGKAVLADTAAQLGTPDMWNKRIQAVLQDGMPAAASVLLDYWFTKPFREAHADQVAIIEELILKTSPEGYAAGCAALRDMDLREAIRSIQAPVLVLTGRHDPVTPPGMGALIASSIPKAKLVTIEAAHLSNVEAPEQFAEKALEFLLTEEPVVEVVEEVIEEAVPEAPAAPKPPKPPRKKPVKKAPPVDIAPIPEPVAAAPVPSEPVEPVAPKKAPIKKAAAKKTPAKKAPVKKAAPKKAAAKATPKKAPAEKGPVKKAAPKKAAPKKAAPKKGAVKKAAVKKAMPKKAAAKKGAIKKGAIKKGAIKKTAVKKAPAKKAAIKKSAAKKAAVKKTAVKKSAVKKAVPSRKTGPAKTARKPVKKAVAKKTSKRR